MPQKLTGRLEALHSKRDINGNTYWALRFTDYATGRTVCGRISGGESNINAIRMGWTVPGEWDRSIEWVIHELPIREFQRTTKDWPYLGCDPGGLQRGIKARLIA